MKKILLSICGVLYSLITFSQQYNGKQAEVIYYDAEQLRYDNRSHAPLFIQLKKTAFISQGQAIKALGNVLKIQAADRLELVRSEQDAMGVNHLRYQQYYQNIKVISGEYILHEKQKRIVAANGIFYDNLKLNIVPTIEASVALQFALNAINAQLYEWEVTTEETIKNSNGESISIITFPKGELVVLPALNGLNIQSPTLCWKFVVCAREPMARYNVYVDANNGEVVWKENLICTIAATGNGTTMYSGSQTFITENVAAYNYRLHDATRGFGVNTFNMLTGTDNSFAIDFTDSDNVWTSAQNQDNAALDAHWGAEKTYDYYLTKHSRNSFDNAGATINAYVHYGSGYNNAFWNGLSVNFGDGDGTQFSPLTELTIVAHELTHGYTQQSSGLFFINESGALNESFSDILGKSIDFWVNPITADWKIGGNCFTPAIAGDALRYMDNPNACGNPDTYLGSYWHSSADDNGGVHTNCGVQNFWFYLLVNGGVGSNDNGFEYNVTGIGIESAAQIAYRCNTVYLTSSSQYADAAFYSLQSATDLFGACSPEAVEVKNAWDAVGVMGLQFNTSASLSATSSNCAGGNIQLNASGGLNYSWNGPENFSSTLQNPIINNAQLSAAGIYYCVITNGICSDSLPIQIALNPSPSITTTATTAICKGDDVQLNATALAGGWGSNIGSNNSEVPIPDYPLLGATSAITISGATSAALITSVTIDSLLHTWDGDLDIKLIAPNGSQITLVSGVGSSGHDFIHTVFSSSAVGDITLGPAPFTGSFYPQQSFSLLSGYGNGSWKLKITDRSGQDVGTLYSWSITLAPDSISSFSWSPLSGLGNASVSDIIVSPITTSVYTVTVNDAIGCAATATTTVMVSDIDVTTAGTTNVSCNGGINGAIDISVAGGLGNYNYSWSNSTVSEDQSMLTFGIYSITVTDSINCIANHTITITEPPLLATSIITSEAHCGNNDGVATAQATGGIGSYTYLWNTGSTVSLINNLAPGIYSVTVTDGNNCSEVIADTVTNTNAVSPMPDPIIGNAWACRNQNNVHYSVPLVPGAISYNWSAPAGTTFTTNNNEINLDFGSTYTTQDLCVSVTTQCGVSQQTCMGISFLVSRPATPGAIVASADACANTIVTYSIGSVQRATTINWTAPANATIISGQGTKIVQVQFNGSFTAGSLSVYASNCIGVSANRVQYLQAIPNTPGNIMGATTNLCAQTGVVYSIAPSNSGATFYTWTMPANVTIINGQGTNSVIASFINAPETGLVCVNATNSCGNSAAKCLPVTVLATRPSSIIGDPWDVVIKQMFTIQFR